MNKALSPAQVAAIVAVVVVVAGLLAYRYIIAPPESSHATIRATSRAEMLRQIHGAQTGGPG